MEDRETTRVRRRHLVSVMSLLVVLPLLFAFGPCDPKPPPGISPDAVKAAVEGAAGVTLAEQPISDEDRAAGARALYGYGGADQITVAVYDTTARAQQGLVDLGSPPEAFQHDNVVVLYYPPADGGTDNRAAIEAAVTAL